MRYHNITTCDMLNGSGLRVVLWLSHCEHKCEGCHNQSTWDKNSGIEFDDKAKVELFNKLGENYISGLTLSGGDPLSTINRTELKNLLQEVSVLFPDKNIWVYTGYKFEEIRCLEVIDYIDVLVDGKFVEELSIPSPNWCGSSNQRIIDVQESLVNKNIVVYQL